MSYHVRYSGDGFSVVPALNPAEQKALQAFADSRRMQTTGGPLDSRDLSSGHPEVIDYNTPPEGQPHLYCDVVPLEDGAKLGVDDARENSDVKEWIQYLIDHVLKFGAVFSDIPEEVDSKDLLHGFTFDHVVNGELEATGEDGDHWLIRVKDNVVTTVKAVFPKDDEDDDA